jgi:hypothetical protein
LEGFAGFGKKMDEKKSGIGGMSAAVPFMESDFRGGACAALLKKRLSVFGGGKREWLAGGGLVAAGGGGFLGFVKNIDEKISGIGGMSAAAPFTMRETSGRTCAT